MLGGNRRSRSSRVGALVAAAEYPSGAGDPSAHRVGERGGGECPRSGSAAWGNPDHGLSVATALSQRGTRWAAHQAAYGPPAADYLGQGTGGSQRDAAQAQGGDPLERAATGQGGRAVAGHSPSHLAEVWAAAAPGRNLQVQLRPAVRRQAGRYRRALSGPAGARAGAVRG